VHQRTLVRVKTTNRMEFAVFLIRD
jgi:hypothetical protein